MAELCCTAAVDLAAVLWELLCGALPAHTVFWPELLARASDARFYFFTRATHRPRHIIGGWDRLYTFLHSLAARTPTTSKDVDVEMTITQL